MNRNERRAFIVIAASKKGSSRCEVHRCGTRRAIVFMAVALALVAMIGAASADSQNWYLKNDGIMYLGGNSGGGDVTIDVGSNYTWRANQSANVSVCFLTGTWNITIYGKVGANEGTNFIAHIGVYNDTTKNFTSKGEVSGDFVNNVQITYPITDLTGFNVPKGEYLALRIYCNDTKRVKLKAENLNSYVTSPANSPDYPGVEGVLAINVTKAVISSGTYYPGTNITYNITVCNIGNMNLTDVTVNDPMLLSPINLGNLAKGACNWTEFNYTVNETDACLGWVNNTVNVSAKDSCGNTISNETSANVSVSYVSALNVMKTVTSSGPYYQDNNITYNITVCNIGNLTLTNVTLNDPKLGLGNLDLGTLAPGECNSTVKNYTVTAGDVCTGWVNNTVNVSALDYCGTTRYNETSANVPVSAIKPPVPTGEATDPTGLAKDEYTEGQPVYAAGSGFRPNKNVSIYILPFQTLNGGEDLTQLAIVGPINVTTDNNGNIAPVEVWPNPVPGHYLIVFDDPDGQYNPGTDPLDDFTVTGLVPVITPLGILALIGLLSIVAIGTIARKNKKR